MAIITLILGHSGTGKTASLRNFKKDECLVIQSVKKPLPFRAKDWHLPIKEGGNIYQTDELQKICNAMSKTKRKIIIVDDFQYILSKNVRDSLKEKQVNDAVFRMYKEIARDAWDIIEVAANLSDDVRVYFMSHLERDENGFEKIKTVGKLTDNLITLEGLFSIVLKTNVRDGNYFFSTKNNGNDTVKSPIDLFDKDLIDNDLAKIDAQIVEYYELTETQPQTEIDTQPQGE